MKKCLIIGILVTSFSTLSAQLLNEKNINKSVKLEELEVPNSPAFILAEITPSLIQTPITPKKFVLGIAQSIQQSGNAFPQNYSAEFTPYWWFQARNTSIYSLLGLVTAKDANGKTSVSKEDPFSGLKFASISMAFLNKDMIPDTISTTQKLFSLGIRTTMVKVHPKKYYMELADKISDWHEAALRELMNSPFQAQVTRETDTAKQRKMIQKYLLIPSSTREIVKEINDIILQKPIFSWDIAAAHMTYGIADTNWRTGRMGVWSNMASYLPLNVGTEQKVNKNYINLNFSVRFLSDHYFKNDKGAIVKANVVDIGGKIAFEFDELSIGYEYMQRTGKGIADGQKRAVGIINYKLSDNLYLNGAFGKNFDLPNKLIALFGIKWGFGTEMTNLPKP